MIWRPESPIGLRAATKGYAHSRRHGIKIFVDSPQQRVRSEKDGGKQRHIDSPAAQVLKLLTLDQLERLFGCRDNGLLQLLQIAEGTFTRSRGRPAGEFQDDQRMRQYLVGRQQ
jgi:hypothetical protein